MARLSRFLSDWRVYLAVAYLALALGVGLLSMRAASQERGLLIDFVCDSIAVRLEQDGPTAEHFAARFAVIMREHGARCSPPVAGLP